MQTSRFQLGLIATLAVGLGFSLSSSEAVGYPAGAAVSYGSNPLWAKAGEASDTGDVVITGTSGVDVVVTDVVLTTNADDCFSNVFFDVPSGETLAYFKLRSDSDGDKTSSIQHSFSSGLPVFAGDSMSIRSVGSCPVAYTLSGYYAQP